MEAEMKNEAHECLTFNSPLEAGIRSVGLLVASYPKCFDIQQLVVFDYLVVHTGDINGPESLHPQIPLRSTELLVRRKLVENGLLLMSLLFDKLAQKVFYIKQEKWLRLLCCV